MFLPRFFRLGLLLGAALLCSSGCGQKSGTVRGKVSLDGSPITFGTVAFIGENGQSSSGQIQSDSSYVVQKAPLGKVVITVQTYPLPPSVQPPDKKGSGEAPKTEARYTRIPAVYGDARKSPLSYTVTAGEQSHDVTLSKSGK
jgi:hypothetical protein